MFWSYLLSAIGIYGLYLAGKKVKWAWLVGASAQTLWIVYALSTKQYGFIVSAIAYAFVYLKNHYEWNRKVK